MTAYRTNVTARRIEWGECDPAGIVFYPRFFAMFDNATTLLFSTAQTVCAGANEAEVEARAKTIGRKPDELRENGIAGTAAEVADTIRRWNAAGAERIYLQVLDLSDLDHLDFIAKEVAPLLA